VNRGHHRRQRKSRNFAVATMVGLTEDETPGDVDELKQQIRRRMIAATKGVRRSAVSFKIVRPPNVAEFLATLAELPEEHRTEVAYRADWLKEHPDAVCVVGMCETGIERGRDGH
jgi:DNA-binding NtrC family response regulator